MSGRANADLLRVLACGSVDDGKSTLLGRLLYEFGAVPDDVLATLERESRRFGTVEAGLDYALLVDGLAAEQEQGVTLDVAYRCFTTPKRRYILADAPGHEQYTANMITGATLADVAVLLIDARRGVLPQTRRHAVIAAELGIRQLVLAVNKMDLVEFRQDVFEAITVEFSDWAARLGSAIVRGIPLCARDGDNVITASPRMSWYKGPSLLAALEEFVPTVSFLPATRLPVQIVLRSQADCRFYAGTIAAGELAVGQTLVNVVSGVEAKVARLTGADGGIECAAVGDAVCVALDRDIDISRGDVLASEPLPTLADRISATVIWLDDAPLSVGRAFVLALGAARITATVSAIQARREITTLDQVASEHLACHEIGSVDISLTQPLVCEPYNDCRELGSFLLLDRLSGATLAAGMVREATSTRRNLRWQNLDVTPAFRATLKAQKPVVLWFTGLPASGKSTIGNLVERKLAALGRHTMLLDGDNVRHGLNRDLGFSEAERVENIRRVAEVANLFADAGLIVVCCFISPYRSDRALACQIAGEGRFLEVYVDTPVAECRRRDPKGHYAKAVAGQIKNFTGVDAPYEPPTAPELCLRTLGASAEELAELVVAALQQRGFT